MSDISFAPGKGIHRKDSSSSFIEEIDFTSSDDLAALTEMMRHIVLLSGLREDMWHDEHEDIIFQFLIDTHVSLLVCYISDNDLLLQYEVPECPITELFYFIKKADLRITTANYHAYMQYGIAKAPFFDSLYNLMTTIYAPMFLEDSKWSDCIKSQLPTHLSKCLTKIFNARNVLKKRIIFYVPREILKYEIDDIIENRDFMGQIEGTVKIWMQLMKQTLTGGAVEERIKGGPIEGLMFWQQRGIELTNIAEQLESKEVKKCLMVLGAAKSSFIHQFNLLYDNIKSQAITASENIKFLSALRKPCEKLQDDALENASKNLKTILNIVHVIFKKSAYYSDENKLHILLRQVNNLLIRICCKDILIDQIFDDLTFSEDEKLNAIMKCLKSWKEQYALSEKVHLIHASVTWDVDMTVVLAPVDAFILRCENFLTICKYKKRFCLVNCTDETSGLLLRGGKGLSVYKLLQSAEESFCEMLKNLGTAKEHALNVQDIVWNSKFAMFKEKVQELELSVVKSLSFAFENLNIVEEGLEILEVIYKFSEQEVVKRILSNYTRVLYDIFLTDLTNLKMEVLKKSINITGLQPMFGGTAYAVSIVPQRLLRVYKAFEGATFLPVTDYGMRALSEYAEVLKAIDEFSYTLFLQWSRAIPKDCISRLSYPILRRNKKDAVALDVSLHRNVIKLIQELMFWEKKRVEIPLTVVSVNQKCNEYVKLKAKAEFISREYNRYVYQF